jgi:glycogen debranching enzyme
MTVRWRTIGSIFPGRPGFPGRIVSLALLSCVCCATLRAQGQGSFQPVPKFAFAGSPLEIAQPANPQRTFTVTGERAGIFGHQDGSFEQWDFPVKVIDQFHITARVEGADAPMEMNRQAAQIDVCPDHTTITYSNAAIVIEQHMFAIRGDTPGKVGAIVVFEIAAARRATITFSFEPVMVPEWPAPASGAPKASWISIGDGGGYLLTTADPSLFGIVAMPGVDRLATQLREFDGAALEFTLQFDPQRDGHLLFPLLMAASYKNGDAATGTANLSREIAEANERLPALYAATHDYYAQFFTDKMTIDTPDASLNKAFQWAELAIDQTRLKLGRETGLAAGWGASGVLARPGFGWFFGRDSLWSIFAIDSYGDFALARDALTFLIARQRVDGKIMHEFSQTSSEIDWAALPYFYASADSTPLFIMAMADYARSSGDLEFIRANWENVKRAYLFMQDHASGVDRLYDNDQGTGWVEDWPTGLPHEEIYLVALERQSAEAMSQLAKWMGDAELASSVAARAKFVGDAVAQFRQTDGLYAFSKRADGSYDTTATIFPSVAWWTGQFSLPEGDAMLRDWSSSRFATDWGLRSVSASSPLYDPLSYHHGSVWPLFTGWVAMAEYKAHRPAAGYQQLMSNVYLTWLQNPGAIPELLSGEFDEPLEQSTWHQLWSSAMVLAPLVRGLLGIEVDATRGTVSVQPKLPASWDRVTIHNVPLGRQTLELAIRRDGSQLSVDAISKTAQAICVVVASGANPAGCAHSRTIHHRVRISLARVEVEATAERPGPGSGSRGMKIIDEQYSARQLSLEVEAPAETTQSLSVRFNGPRRTLSVAGASRDGDMLRISFPPGVGYTTQKIHIVW